MGRFSSTVRQMGSTRYQAIQNCSFLADTAGSGGSIYSNDSGFGSLLIDSTSFSGNYATRSGGAIRNKGGSPILTHCTFTKNTAVDEGGAIRNNAESVDTSYTMISKCKFQETFL